MQRGLATLDSYTAAVNKLEAAAALFTASADKYADAYERIIAVLQERASVVPVDTTTEAYQRIDALEAEIARMKTSSFDLGEAN